MSDPIIDPAPAQVCVGNSADQTPTSIVSPNKSDDKIAELKKILRVIKNTSQPLDQYLQFQQILDPRIRVLVDINQWVLMMTGTKSAIISMIDNEYVKIKNPPEDLIDDMEDAYDNIDLVYNAFIKSMKQTINLIQSQIIHSEHNTNLSQSQVNSLEHNTNSSQSQDVSSEQNTNLSQPPQKTNNDSILIAMTDTKPKENRPGKRVPKTGK